MTVATLVISQFRNLQQISLKLSPGLNLIIGANASGKTSLIEALYYLGRTRSFRTRHVHELIHQQADFFRLVAAVQAEGRQISIGLQRSRDELSLRLDGRSVRSLAEIAAQLPVLLLNPDSHRLLEDGPQQRRRFLDWGLFHADSSFWPLWQRFNDALKQRNSALRTQSDVRAIAVWEHDLAQTGEHIDSRRQAYCQALLDELKPLARQLLDSHDLTLDYRRGWTRELSLLDVLQRDRSGEQQRGYTRYGPQRADFQIKLAGQPIAQSLSRGQQKLLVCALILAQARLFYQQRQQNCTLLIDDLPAELDSTSRSRIMSCLAEQPLQLLITAIEAELLDTSAWPQMAEFYLNAGHIRGH